MLQKIRDRATGPLAWFIVGIICVPFAFFGVEAFRDSGGPSDVAKVGGESISDAALRQSYEQRYQQLQQMFGENFRADMIDPAMLRESVLNGLIQESVNRQYMDSSAYRVSDEKLLGYIRAQDAFQENGNFSPSLYKERLARQGMNPLQYEDRVRAFLTEQQLRQAVTSTAVLTDSEVAQSYAWEKQERRFAHRVYKAEALRKGIEISDEAISQRYDERKEQLLAPERVRVSYIELDRDALKDKVTVDNGALQQMYDAEKDSRFAEPEQRMARHILIRSSTDDAEGKIKSLAQQLKDGADFAQLAKDNSQDPGSKNRGGDLGWVTRGMMVPPFEEALFALEVGAVSEPVESTFGWHLIELQDLRAATVRPFDDAAVQEELQDMYREKQAREQFTALSEQLEQLSFENPADLAPAASALNLEIKTSEWFTRAGGAGIAADDAVVTAAFSPVVLNDRENSQPISIGRRQVVLRLAEHEPQRQQTLEEVRDDLRNQLITETVAQQLQAEVQTDQARLESGEVKLAELANSDAAKTEASVQVARNAVAPARALVQAAFRLAAPASGAASYDVVTMPGGQDLALIELTDVIDGDWSKASDADKTAARRNLMAEQSNQEFAALQEALRQQTKVKVLRQEL